MRKHAVAESEGKSAWAAQRHRLGVFLEGTPDDALNLYDFAGDSVDPFPTGPIIASAPRGGCMFCPRKYVRSVLMVACLASPLMFTRCATHAGYYRAYDPYYRDYHVWRDGEVVYYNRWARETRRDSRRDFRRLRRKDQR